MKVFLTAQAHRDIAAIKEVIAKNSPSAAERIAASLYDQAAGLAKSPKKGVALSVKFDIDTDLRMWIVRPNLILYRVTDDRIIVTRIINERQNYLAALGFTEYSKDDDTADD
jgi:plasmid stabilization system protein ParE